MSWAIGAASGKTQRYLKKLVTFWRKEKKRTVLGTESVRERCRMGVR